MAIGPSTPDRSHNLFHVKLWRRGKLGIAGPNRRWMRVLRLRGALSAGPQSRFHVKPGLTGASLEWVDDQPAQKLRVEVRALGGHAFAMFADDANVIDRGRHDQRGQWELLALDVLFDFLHQ